MWRLICNPPGYHSLVHVVKDAVVQQLCRRTTWDKLATREIAAGQL